jgi:hypothetical protein
MNAIGGRQGACDSTLARRKRAKSRPGLSAKVAVALSKGA